MAPVLERTSPVQLARPLTAKNELTQEKEAFAIVYTLILVSVSAIKSESLARILTIYPRAKVARIAYVRYALNDYCKNERSTH